MQIEEKLRRLQARINSRLGDYFRKKIKKLKKNSDLTADLAQKVADFTMAGGKRLRPILVYYGYLAAGGGDKKAILDASIFAELLHSYLLIHDDIIDRDEKRRGSATVHKSYEAKYKKKSNEAKHLGISGAIMAGDLAASFAYEILANSKFTPALKQGAIKRLNQVLEDVICGQTLDIFSGLGGGLEKEDILKIMEYKTARYTIEGPLHIGAILAGAPDKILKILSRFAIPLGIAFQLKDDILGIFGEEDITGKSASSDIKEGKETLLIVETLQHANKNQKKEILRAFGNPNATKKQIQNVRETIKSAGALDRVNSEATRSVFFTRGIIEKSDLSREAKEFLIGISDYILEREK